MRSREDEDEDVRFLWRYHDWLGSQGLVLCERMRRHQEGSEKQKEKEVAYTYQPVRAGPDLVARFLAHEARAEQATGEGTAALGEREQAGKGHG